MPFWLEYMELDADTEMEVSFGQSSNASSHRVPTDDPSETLASNGQLAKAACWIEYTEDGIVTPVNRTDP